ncbi:membrane bound O-acyl transferase family-domain-containing protein, partial [Melanogaster broomeanus]
TGNGYLDFLLGSSLLTCAVDGVNLLLIANPLYSFRHEQDKVPAYELPFPQRYFWVVCMCQCPRGVGWSYKQVNHLPSASTRSRVSFVTWCLLRVVAQYTLLEAALIYSRYNPAFTSSATITAQPFFMRCMSVAAFVAQTYAAVNCLYFLAAAVTVAAGFYEPRSWPDVFGHWREGYTLGRFWGRTWHQLLRRFFSGFGKAATRALGIPPHTKYASGVQVVVGFLISGLVDAGGDAMLDVSRAGFSFRFFLLQPLGIFAEEAVICVARFVGIKKSPLTRLVGYAWVFIWLSICLPPWLDDIVDGATRMRAQGIVGSARMTALEVVAGWVGIDIESLMLSWFANA